jgi:hypothetical protein
MNSDAGGAGTDGPDSTDPYTSMNRGPEGRNCFSHLINKSSCSVSGSKHPISGRVNVQVHQYNRPNSLTRVLIQSSSTSAT